jgi:predicted ATPase
VLTSITLQNFKSFGEEQKIPLEPISVLVGPNNSGKSNLVSLARFVRNAATGGVDSAIEQEGGADFLVRRPATGNKLMRIEWHTDEGTEDEGVYTCTLERSSQATSPLVQRNEQLQGPKLGEAWAPLNSTQYGLRNPSGGWFGHFWAQREPLGGLRTLFTQAPAEVLHFLRVGAPIVLSREIKLSVPALRRDAGVIPDPQLATDGAGLAAVLGLWRGASPERAEELDKFIRGCLPEIARVLVKPGPVPGEQRLWVQQKDGEQFDAAHLSDGVLCFMSGRRPGARRRAPP